LNQGERGTINTVRRYAMRSAVSPFVSRPSQAGMPGRTTYRFALQTNDSFSIFVGLVAGRQVGGRRIVKLGGTTLAVTPCPMAKNAIRFENHFAATHRDSKNRQESKHVTNLFVR
jgi:hypothetical protein